MNKTGRSIQSIMKDLETLLCTVGASEQEALRDTLAASEIVPMPPNVAGLHDFRRDIEADLAKHEKRLADHLDSIERGSVVSDDMHARLVRLSPAVEAQLRAKIAAHKFASDWLSKEIKRFEGMGQTREQAMDAMKRNLAEKAQRRVHAIAMRQDAERRVATAAILDDEREER